MGSLYAGTVMEKNFLPPPGAPEKYWCYLMIQTDSDKRLIIRLHQKHVNHVTIGDRIRFEKTWRKNKRVRKLEVLEKSHL